MEVIHMFKTIVWRNWILRKRHWFVTSLEAAFPCVTIILLLLHRRIKVSPASDNDIVPTRIYEPYSVDKCFQSYLNAKRYIVAFTPNSSLSNEIINKTKERIWYVPENRSRHTEIGPYLHELKLMDNEQEMENYFHTFMLKKTTRQERKPTIFYGIVFETNEKIFQYKIRVGNLLRTAFISEGQFYKNSCFLTLQKTLDSVYIEIVTNKTLVKPVIMMNEFPYPEYSVENKQILLFSEQLLIYFVVFGFFTGLPSLIKEIVEEKETGAKELIKIMGFKGWMVWVGWLLYADMINIFNTVIATGLFTEEISRGIALIPYSNPIIVWLLLFLYINAITVYLFVVCALCYQPTIALVIGIPMYFIPAFIFKMNLFPTSTDLRFKLAYCLIPTKALIEGFRIIFSFNKRHIGVQFDNLFTSATNDENDLDLGRVLVMLVLDICIYSIITWYIDNINPGPYGQAKPWNFVFNICCKDSNVEKIKANNDEEENRNEQRRRYEDIIHIEKPPEHIKVGLSIKNLRKVFPSNICAIDNVNMDIYEGEITAILGRNGAGKTTLLSIITGVLSATSGNIYQRMSYSEHINILNHMDDFRRNLGFCPQYNILFPYLTVIEHLIFYGMIKNGTVSEAITEGHILLCAFNIIGKENALVDKLSRGMRRKLSLAIALIRSPHVLVLDEPTSNMDLESRREIWDILSRLRRGRTIIITTHIMEEADLIGDRIAIMDHGKLRCYGTKLFLKRVYTVGYTVTLMTSLNAIVQSITELITSLVPGSKLNSYKHGHLVYNVPRESSSNFGFLFAEIEKRKSSLQITSISVSCSKMEDVFLKVREITDKTGRNHQVDETTTNFQENNSNAPPTTEREPSDIVSSNQLVKNTNNLQENNFNTPSPEREPSDRASSNQLAENTNRVSSNQQVEDTNQQVENTNRISSNEQVKNTSNLPENNRLNEKCCMSESVINLTQKRHTGMKLIFIQLKMLLLKKIKFTFRKIGPYVLYTILAALMVYCAVVALLAEYEGYKNIKFNIDIDLYKGSEVFMTCTFQKEVLRYKDIYKSLITKSKFHLLPEENITIQLLNIAQSNIERYNLKVIVAADLTADVATGLYSSLAIHSSPISLNLITNTLLKSYKENYSIVVFNHPLINLPVVGCLEAYFSETPMFHKIFQFFWAVTLPISILFFIINFISFTTHERVTNFKHLQLMAGVSPITYWFSTFIWDYIIFLFISFLLVVVIFCTDTLRIVSNIHEICVFFIIINVYGLSAIPYAYFFSFLKISSSRGSGYFMYYNILFGFGGLILYYFFSSFNVANIFITYIFTLNPYFCIAIVLYKFSLTAFEKTMCRLCLAENRHNISTVESINRFLKCDLDKSYFTFDNESGIGIYLIMLFLDMILYIEIILLTDYGYTEKFYGHLNSFYVKQGDLKDLDDDVLDELNRVGAAKMRPSTTLSLELPALIVDNLKKTSGMYFHSIRGISFKINSGECFGMLGRNGSGKTTLLKLLVGQQVLTEGDATIKKYSLTRHRREYLKQIGFCPEFEGLNDMMTGRELLHLFGRLRGINSEDCHRITNYWLEQFDLDEYSDRLCGTYSYGNRRKLSAAIALIGHPIIVFLDEPTSGVDPTSKRKLWNALGHCQKSGQSIVVSTHSTDECGAICDRVTIMANGQLVCIGSVEHLKQKFCLGFEIVVKLYFVRQSDKALTKLKQDIEETFAPNCELKDKHALLLYYYVSGTSKTWSMLFNLMESIKIRHSALVEDYTISEALEDLFIMFSRSKRMKKI